MRPSVCYTIKKVSAMKQQKGRQLTSTNLMTVSMTTLSLKRPAKNITSNVKQCRLLVLARKVIVEDIMRAVWPIVEPVAHCVGSGTLDMSEGIPEIFDVVH